MDIEIKEELKKQLKWFLKQPMMLWLFFSMMLLFTESLFKGNPYYGWITLGFAISYTFCMIMFMRGLQKATLNRMRYFEKKAEGFISDSVKRGLGRVTYMIPDGEPEGFVRKVRSKIFGTTYICPYVASFIDTGVEHQKAHIRIPVTKRKMFQLKLMGCYKTTDRERAVKALEFLGVDWPLP